MAEVLVTGGAGFIGYHSVRCLLAGGHSVTAVDIRAPLAELRACALTLQADMGDPALIDRICAGMYDAVLHLGAITDTTERDTALLQHHNVELSMRLAEACARGGARFVYASSHSVYGSIVPGHLATEDINPGSCSGPLNAYAWSKLQLDIEVHELSIDTGLPFVGLRFTNVFGTGEERKGRMASILSQIIRRATSGREVLLFHDTLEAKRDFVPVEIVAETCAHFCTQRTPSGVFNVGSGVPISFGELLSWCQQIAGSPIRVLLVDNPHASSYQYWTGADLNRLRVAYDAYPEFDAATLYSAVQALWTQSTIAR